MSKDFHIFVVDDDAVIRESLTAILENDYDIEVFGDAESCDERLRARVPHLILLDVNLPGMDGYAFCRRLKDDEATRDIAITFVSAHDTLDARIAGYEAGGDDFIVKPFDVGEVRRKVQVTERLRDERERVAERARSAETFTSVVMASMNDYAVLVTFLGKTAGCNTAEEVCAATMEALASYSLEGVVQIRLRGGSFTYSKGGRDVPMEVSILNHVSSMERIFEFKTRAVFNHGRVTIMVNNMPVTDPDTCGRIRDNLAIVAQGADARLEGIEAEHDVRRKEEGIRALLGSVATTITLLRERQRRDQTLAAEITFQLQEDLANSFVHLGLTTGQEQFLEDLVRRSAGRLVELSDSGAETQAALETLGQDLQRLSC